MVSGIRIWFFLFKRFFRVYPYLESNLCTEENDIIARVSQKEISFTIQIRYTGHSDFPHCSDISEIMSTKLVQFRQYSFYLIQILTGHTVNIEKNILFFYFFLKNGSEIIIVLAYTIVIHEVCIFYIHTKKI